jgi:protein tyrosine/serine phosphatase
MTSPPRVRSPRAFTILAVVLGVVAVLSAWPVWLRLSGNVHVIEPDVLIRSGQLGPEALTALIRDQSIRTVINLRGEHPEKAWYRDEQKATSAAGTTLVNLKLSATRVPTEEEAASLTQALSAAQRPVLIHCEGGADRTGLASALYLALVEHRPVAEARRQLSIWFGHIPFLGNRTEAMDRAFDRMAAMQP